MLRRAGWWGIIASSLAPVAAFAQTVDRPRAESCFQAAEAAQPLLKSGRLRDAQRELLLCAREGCPRAARADCRGWLDDVRTRLPTVVFRARQTGPGGDVAIDDVRVLADGEVVVPGKLEETPVPLDPGSHTLRFEHAGAAPVELAIELKEGEIRRIVDVVFGREGRTPTPTPTPTSAPTPSPNPSPSPGASPSPSPMNPSAGAVPVAAWVLGGGAVLALGVGAVFEGVGLSNRSGLVGSCQPSRTCAPSAVDSARSQVAVGDVGLAVGALLLAGAAYVYFTRPTAPETGIRLRFGPLPGGAGGAIEGAL